MTNEQKSQAALRRQAEQHLETLRRELVRVKREIARCELSLSQTSCAPQ